MGRKLSNKDKSYLLSLKPEDITFDLLVSLFADTSKKENDKLVVVPSRIKPTDEFSLAPGEYFNKTKIDRTTAGQFIYNKLIVERELKDILGYVNYPINKSGMDTIEDKLSKALLDDEITIDDFVKYLNRTQWLAMQFHAVIATSFTYNTLKPHPEVIKLRDKLIKENKEKLEAGDVITAVNIENQLVKLAKEKLKDDPGLDLYRSGARGKFENNYKNIAIMKGPVFNPVTGKFDIVESNFIEGIKKEEIDVYGNAIITGAYPKAIGTAISGYFSKQIIAALQAVTLDKHGSDCGTKGTKKIVIKPNLVNDFIYRYIVENGKLILLDDKNIDKYIGKEVKMRSPMYCIGKKLCNKCAGEMYYKLNIENIGLTAARVSSTLLNLSMKKFHDSTAQITKININDITL